MASLNLVMTHVICTHPADLAPGRWVVQRCCNSIDVFETATDIRFQTRPLLVAGLPWIQGLECKFHAGVRSARRCIDKERLSL